ncbi:MAG: hypothetical protein V1808_03085 [Candidatus Daviesbacteria bacterium]
MSIEIPQEYISIWKDKPKQEVVEGLASVCHESWRISDPYSFIQTTEGKLYSPAYKCLVEDSIRRETWIGELEYQGFKKIEEYVLENDEGIIFWVSPQDFKAYPDDSKIVISEIQKTIEGKSLFNRAIILDIDGKTCFEMAKKLANYCSNKPEFVTINQVRSNPLILKNSIIHWTYILEELVDDLSLEHVRKGEDVKRKEKTLKEVEGIYQELFDQNEEIEVETVVVGVEKAGMVGNSPLSCPPGSRSRGTAFTVFFNNSEQIEGCKKIKCKKCSWEASDEEAKKVVKGEITCCPECGWKP